MANRILIVDDNLGDRKLAEEALEELDLNWDITYAQNADEAVRAAKRDKPDLILMDVLLPGDSGGDAVRALKENRQTEDIPVVFLTSAVNDKEEEHKKIVILNQRYSVLSKPVTPKKLKKILDQFDQIPNEDFCVSS